METTSVDAMRGQPLPPVAQAEVDQKGCNAADVISQAETCSHSMGSNDSCSANQEVEERIAAATGQSKICSAGTDDNGTCSASPESERPISSRKRRRVIEDDEELAEKATREQTCEGKLRTLLAGEEEEDGATDDEDEAEAEDPTPKPRLVLLSVKIPGSHSLKFAVSEDILHEIPSYSIKLDKAKSQASEGKRICVTDSKIRKEEVMVQAIEYLMDGILEPLGTADSDADLATLNELTQLYELSITLNIVKLEEAIVSHIGSHDLDPLTLLYWAAECYKEGKNGLPMVAPDSSLGKLIKQYLAENLDSLAVGEAYEFVRNAGGSAFNKQLMEVFAEEFVKQGMGQRAGEGVKVEDGE